jgi:hypothetical protein
MSTAILARNPNMLEMTTSLELKKEKVLPLMRLPRMRPT